MSERTVQDILNDVYKLINEWEIHYKVHNVSICETVYSVTIECYRKDIRFFESLLLNIDGINSVFTCRDIFKYAHVTGHINKSLQWE